MPKKFICFLAIGVFCSATDLTELVGPFDMKVYSAYVCKGFKKQNVTQFKMNFTLTPDSNLIVDIDFGVFKDIGPVELRDTVYIKEKGVFNKVFTFKFDSPYFVTGKFLDHVKEAGCVDIKGKCYIKKGYYQLKNMNAFQLTNEYFHEGVALYAVYKTKFQFFSPQGNLGCAAAEGEFTRKKINAGK